MFAEECENAHLEQGSSSVAESLIGSILWIDERESHTFSIHKVPTIHILLSSLNMTQQHLIQMRVSSMDTLDYRADDHS